MSINFPDESICEQFVNVEIEEDILCSETDLNVIGASLNTTLRGTLFTASDATTIYCDSLNGADGNAGTNAAPKKTLSASFAALGSKRKIQLKDDTLPYNFNPEQIPAVSGLDVMQIQSALGEACHVYLDQKSALKVSINSTVDSFYQHAQLQNIRSTSSNNLIITNESDTFFSWDGTTLNDGGHAVATYKYTKMWRGLTQLANPIGTASGFWDCSFILYNKTGYIGSRWTISYVSAYQNTVPWPVDVVANSKSAKTGVLDFCVAYINTPPLWAADYEYYAFIVQQESLNVKKLYLFTMGYLTGAAPANGSILIDLSDPTCCEYYHGTVYVGTNKGIYTYVFKLGVTPTASQFILEPVDAEYTTCLYTYYESYRTISDNDRIYAGLKNGWILEYNPTTLKWSKYINIGYEVRSIKCKTIKGMFSIMYVTDLNDALYRIDMNKKTWSKCDPAITAYDLEYWLNGNDNMYQGFYILNTAWGLYKKFETIDIPNCSQFCGIKFEPYKDKHSGFRICYNTASDPGEEQKIIYCDLNNLTNHIFWETSTTTTPLYPSIGENNLSNSQYGTYLLSNSASIDTAHNGTFNLAFNRNNIWNVDEIGLCGNLVDDLYDLASQEINHNNFFNMKTAIRNTSIGGGGAELTITYNNFLNITDYFAESVINAQVPSLYDNVVYNCNLGSTNCLESITYPTINKHPLFRNIIEDEEDFHLMSECSGELFDSPSIRISPITDVGAHSVSRTTLTAYNTAPEILINYKPNSLEIMDEKSDEELTTNFEGRHRLLSRPVPSRTLKFEYTDSNYQGKADPYEILYLYSCHNHKLKLWFNGLKGVGDKDMSISTIHWSYSLNSLWNVQLTLVDILMPYHQLARPYLYDQGYTKDDIFCVLYHNYNQTTYPEYKWKLNQWNGWYIYYYDVAYGTYFDVKIRFSYDKYIWVLYDDLLDILSTYAPADDSGGPFCISYYKCILKTTQQSATKRRMLNIEPLEDENNLYTGSLEFVEV